MGETFNETQRYRKWWMILMVLLFLLLPVVSVHQQIILRKPFGTNPAPDGVLLFFAVLMIGIVVLFLKISLNTSIGWDGISIHYAPFFKTQILWSQIASAEIVDYGFLGGWGFRYSKKYGMVYNVTGRVGLSITLTNNRRFVIGTQKPGELRRVIKEYMPNFEPKWVQTENK